MEITCTKCGSCENFRIVSTGTHIKVICTNCLNEKLFTDTKLGTVLSDNINI